MATGTIPYDRMLGYKLIIWEDTAPAAGNAYRSTVTGASSGNCVCIGFEYYNTNGSWYQVNGVAWMNGPDLRFGVVSGDAYAERPFKAYILTK